MEYLTLIIGESFLSYKNKRERHGGSSNDFTNENFIIEYPGEDFSTQVGAGDDAAIVGETGWNSSGSSGIYQIGNQYQYKYEFEYLWIDVTIIRTKNRKRYR